MRPIHFTGAAKQKLDRNARVGRCMGTSEIDDQPALSFEAARNTRAKNLHQKTPHDPTNAPGDLEEGNK